MTLVLAWMHCDAVVVVSDTLFSSNRKAASEIGPKIFNIPISATSLMADLKVDLPSMGFAFAGSTSLGQFTHAMATTCLGQLTSAVISGRPNVKDVAEFYGKCGMELIREQRRHYPVDSYKFEGIICGNEFRAGDFRSASEACHFQVFVNALGEPDCRVNQIDFSSTPVFAIGSRASEARKLISSYPGKHSSFIAVKVMDEIISSSTEKSVGGCIQGGVSTKTGLELRPILRNSARNGEYYGVMGISIFELGAIGGFVPMNFPLMLDDMAANPNADMAALAIAPSRATE